MAHLTNPNAYVPKRLAKAKNLAAKRLIANLAAIEKREGRTPAGRRQTKIGESPEPFARNMIEIWRLP